MITVLEIARRLLARGLSVIPVPRPIPGTPPNTPGDGKTPLLRWKPFQTRLPTRDELERWFGADPMNLAVVTGAISGVVVVDADDGEALRFCMRRLPYTPWQTKTGRGVHLWFRHPGVDVHNQARIETGAGTLRIDVRGDGGYVIAPGSRHMSGAAYHFAGDWTAPRAQLPVFVPTWLAKPAVPAPAYAPSLPRDDRDLVARARSYLAAIPRPEIGRGSDAAVLYAACRVVRGFALNASDAEDLLWEWAGGRPGWTREWVAQKVAHAERYGTEPFGGLQ